MSQHAILRGKVGDWFPLLPRPRPPSQALHLRVDEIRGLACSASQGPDEIRISLAAEALNKAALIASDCGLVDLARQLCWRQFDIFQAATPLTARTAKLALHPIVNLGRLATRGGDGARALTKTGRWGDALRHLEQYPEIFLTGAAELGVTPEHCFVVEDAASGVQVAKAGVGADSGHD